METGGADSAGSGVGVIAKDAIQVTPIWAPGIPRLMLHGFVKQPLKIRLAGTGRLIAETKPPQVFPGRLGREAMSR